MHYHKMWCIYIGLMRFSAVSLSLSVCRKYCGLRERAMGYHFFVEIEHYFLMVIRPFLPPGSHANVPTITTTGQFVVFLFGSIFPDS